MSRKLVLLSAFVLFLSFLVIRVCGHDPSYEIVAVHGSTPTIDGFIDPIEWSDAASVSFNETEVLIKQDGVNLYIAFNVSNKPFQEQDTVVIEFDVDHNGNTTLQPDDVGLGVYRNGTLIEANVTEGAWATKSVSSWTAKLNSTSDIWQVEFNITYPKIEVTAGIEKTVGVTFLCFLYPGDGSPTFIGWPPNSPINAQVNPSSWGDMTSAGYNWIPEFPSLIILPLFMIATLLAVIVYRRKRIT